MFWNRLIACLCHTCGIGIHFVSVEWCLFLFLFMGLQNYSFLHLNIPRITFLHLCKTRLVIRQYLMKSFIIWLDNIDCFNVNWMPYLLIKFSWLSKNLNTVPIEENNVNLSCRFQCCCQSLHYNTYVSLYSILHTAIWMARLVLLCLSNVRQCVFRTQYWNYSFLHPTN